MAENVYENILLIKSINLFNELNSLEKEILDGQEKRNKTQCFRNPRHKVKTSI